MGWDIDVREKIYLRLANEIFFRILHGEYAQGEKLPSYAELAKKAGCSPETVRKAIRELQQQGVVENLRVGYAVTSDSTQITAYRQCDTVLNHTGLYEYRHGKMLMHLRFTFESLNTLNSPGEYVRYYRQLRGLTTRQLAEKLNIVPATVLAYEQERFPIPYEISIAAAETLHISEELLFDDFCIFISAPYTEILHTVRKRYGLNQVDFAQKAGISPSIYAKWEAGNRRPSRKMYQQLKAIYPEI